tara:strand:- start:358 stop:1032 length:675 start_codon:yes stop_codon:yes gene_type:complete
MIIKITYKKIIIIFLFLIFVKNLLSVDSHKNLLNILEYNFPLEITFEQTHRDEKINGWMVIYGNGMARTEFEPPNNNIIVADGRWIIFYDPYIDRTTYIPLDSGIFEALLNPKSLNKDNNFKVFEVTTKDTIDFIIEFNLNNNNQKVIISFDKQNSILLGWKLYESKDDYINVKVKSLKKFQRTGVKLDKFFKLSESSIKTEDFYFGPYKKRKVKKVLGSGRLN